MPHPNAKKIQFTQEGLENLKIEQTKLLQERPDAVLELKKAREMGDLSENGAYKGARFKLSQIDRRLRELQYLLRYADVQETPEGIVGLNTLVTVSDDVHEKQFHIVGEHEANPLNGKISPRSPIGSQLMGRRKGERVVIQTPKGIITYIIVSIAKNH